MNRLIDTLFEMGKAKGFEAQEVYYSSSESMTVSAYQGEIEKFGISKDGGLSYRGIIDGKLGYAYTERIDESSLEMLVEEAYANGKAIESEDKVFIFGEKRGYVEVKSFDPGLEQVPVEDKIQMPLLLEKRVKEIAPELSDVSSCTYIESVSEMRMRNTLGLDLSDRSNYCLLYGVAMLKDGGETYTAYDGVIGNRFGDLDVEAIAQNMVREVRSKVGASPIPSGNYKVLFRYDAFAHIFETFLGLFDADRVQKGLSAFQDKLDQTVASPVFSLEDHPHLEDGIASHSFDAEGYPTSRKWMIREGKLCTFLHNLKSAHKAGVESTGNASKSGYKGAIGISPSNLVCSVGDKSYEELIASVGDGVIITEVAGLHSGVNEMSGDFSLMAEGFRICDGKQAEAMRQVTVSGNFFELLKEIEEMGADRRNPLQSSMYTPSVVVRQLSISGE